MTTAPVDMTAPPRSFAPALATVLALGPFAIDMYLASLPEIGETFSAPPWAVQLTLTGYLLLLGLGQIVAGPISDAFGRRRPLFIGLVTFIAGCLLAALAPNMIVLVLARMLQGVGGAIAFVVANSSVRDRTRGDAATRVFALLMTVTAVAPILAPVLGGFLGQALGWRSVFVALAVLGVVALVVARSYLPESLEPAQRAPLRFTPVLRAYGHHLRNPRFVCALTALGTAFVFLFSYLGGASYVYQGHFDLDQAAFGLVFGATGVSVLLGAVTAHRLTGRLSTARLAILGTVVTAAGAAVALLGALDPPSLPVVAVGIGLGLAGLGCFEPALMALCMSAVETDIGAASALIGALQYLLGAATTALVALVATSGPLPWTTALLVVAAATVLLTLVAARTARDAI
jgi:DHA1 family bicyclomycin/chloramphenicol resistance-like MFS transporter